jgi:hypothetical protein
MKIERPIWKGAGTTAHMLDVLSLHCSYVYQTSENKSKKQKNREGAQVLL